jgi:hypothetical protein
MASPCRTPPPGASLSPCTMHDPSVTPAELLTKSRLAKDQGWQWLTAGAGVGAIGALGALAGAVCPLCVVATPALLGAGLARTAWARSLERRAQAQAAQDTSSQMIKATTSTEPPPMAT